MRTTSLVPIAVGKGIRTNDICLARVQSQFGDGLVQDRRRQLGQLPRGAGQCPLVQSRKPLRRHAAAARLKTYTRTQDQTRLHLNKGGIDHIADSSTWPCQLNGQLAEMARRTVTPLAPLNLSLASESPSKTELRTRANACNATRFRTF